jgi:hypothetical protein
MNYPVLFSAVALVASSFPATLVYRRHATMRRMERGLRCWLGRV